MVSQLCPNVLHMCYLTHVTSLNSFHHLMSQCCSSFHFIDGAAETQRGSATFPRWQSRVAGLGFSPRPSSSWMFCQSPSYTTCPRSPVIRSELRPNPLLPIHVLCHSVWPLPSLAKSQMGIEQGAERRKDSCASSSLSISFRCLSRWQEAARGPLPPPHPCSADLGEGLPPQTPHCLLAPVEGERRQGAWRGETAIPAITWNTLQQL